jgi:outer membrane protein OmpA-like peptidoglycan-associated protein
MKLRIVVVGIAVALLFTLGCAPRAYFGVPSKAAGVPPEFGQTEAAIAKAEQSPGAQYCPELIAKAKELARTGVEEYWACRTQEAMYYLDKARRMAANAEKCEAPAPAPVAKAVPPPPPPPAKGECIVALKGTNFGFDSWDLTPEGMHILDAHIDAFMTHPDFKVEIVGHTDSIGPEQYNKELSEKRAKTVFYYLINHNVPANRIMRVMGKGESEPIAPNDTKEGRAENRRVEIRVCE